jgi:hypothetical protein
VQRWEGGWHSRLCTADLFDSSVLAQFPEFVSIPFLQT